MSDWSSGYVSDIGYTFGYFAELNPLNIKLAFLNAGLVFPEVGTACELGFGQGLSPNLHAAATLCQWSGTDFNPAQASYAQELAEASGASPRLFDEAFEDFANREDLPDFDFICLHGIWSWISDENRSVIVDFIRRKLKVGGVLYVSYNTQPGWAGFAPFRHLLTEYTERIGAQGKGIVSNINDALGFAEQLLGIDTKYALANPQIEERVKKLREQDPHYLAHEYFNRDWHPMHFATMSGWLESAKLSFACSANNLDHIDALNLSPEQQTFLNGIPDPIFRESVLDFITNQQFRKDYWVKGRRTHTVLDKVEITRALRFVLTTPREDVSLKVKGARGTADMSEAIYGPILDLMASHKVMLFADIEMKLADKNIDYRKLLEALMVLVGSRHVAIAQEEAIVNKAKTRTRRLNAFLIKKARSANDTSYLASPVIGGGFPVNRFQQLFLDSIFQNEKKPSEWADSAWKTLCLQGEKLLKDGKGLETPEENIAELTARAEEFNSKWLPVLKAIQIV